MMARTTLGTDPIQKTMDTYGQRVLGVILNSQITLE